MTISWLIKYFKKQKWRTRSNVKSYESLESVLTNVNIREKNEREGFY